MFNPQPSELLLPHLIRESRRLRREFEENVARLRLTRQRRRTAAAEAPWTQSVESSPAPSPEHSDAHLLDGLTARQIQVLRLIAEGKSSKEIAAELGVAFRTAVCHRYRIFQKLGVHETATAVRLAVRAGLIRP
jgi:DNA-binding NarL/FixJ family response regulator